MNKEADGKIQILLKDFEDEVIAEYRSVVIHLVVLHNREELYKPINEFFDGKVVLNCIFIFYRNSRTY